MNPAHTLDMAPHNGPRRKQRLSLRGTQMLFGTMSSVWAGFSFSGLAEGL